MFGSTILDAAIAMVFIYLLASLVVSAANELIASVLRLRAKNLFAGIKELLQEDESKLTSLLYQHPLISGLAKKGGKPSYIPSRTFVLAFLDVIAPLGTNTPRTMDTLQSAISNLPEPLKKALTTLSNEGGHDVELFKSQLEIWFNNTMERASGWYKRRTQWIQLVFAIGFAVCLNIDSVHIGQTLFAVHSPLREALVEQAKPFLASHNSYARTCYGGDQHCVSAHWMGRLPLEGVKPNCLRYSFLASRLANHGVSSISRRTLWFDLLNKFINIRGAGKAPEEQPKEPKAVPNQKVRVDDAHASDPLSYKPIDA